MRGLCSTTAAVSGLLIMFLGAAGVVAGCGDDTSGDSSRGASASSASNGAGGQGGGGGGGAGAACETPATDATRGSPIAISPDDTVLVVANRDVGTVSVLHVDYADGKPKLTKTSEIDVGGEPWQVAIDGCGTTAYVILRKDQKLVEITGLAGDPAKGKEVLVGSEPTGLALTPSNRLAYVANWVEGTVSVVDTASMAVQKTIDLNAALAKTGLLGTSVSESKSRPGLAHPRSVAITNSGDANDDDEKVYVTEYFAQRIAPEGVNGADADVSRKGLLYAIKVSDGSVAPIDLAPLADTGFKDSKGAATGCFPNQLQSVTVNGTHAYVNSVCASPEGPLGVFQKKACAGNAQCTDAGSTCDTTVGACTLQCVVDTDCGFGSPAGTCVAGGVCKPITTNVKTTTHPVLYVVDTATDTEVTGGTANLNKAWDDEYGKSAVADDGTRRYPLVADDTAFVPGSGVAYVTANGTDAVFRIKYTAAGTIEQVGAGADKLFINLGPAAAKPEQKGKNPVGMTIAHAKNKPFAFVANDVSRNVTALDLPKQIVAGSDADPADARVGESTAQPTDAKEQARLRGKRFFFTGLGRWSLKGQGWGACQSCHTDGLTDNVTWYFARGPRQSISLDGTFASKDPNDQRILNYTAIFDEMHDFENNTRGVSGGVGAIVSVDPTPSPAQASDRINLNAATANEPAGNNSLNGSAEGVTNSLSVIKDWNDITEWTRIIRSPRAPAKLDATKVAAGEALFQALDTGGRCQGCHGGAKWTISKRFYAPSGATNEALLAVPWDGSALVAAGFPDALLPAAIGGQFMRFPNPKNANLDQIQCVLREVGTFGKSPADVGVAEVRADMSTPAQGAETNGHGYNPPSLLGLQMGAPYLHAGNARTLEELFTDPGFAPHWKALSKNVNYLAQDGDVDNLVAYLLSIDEDKESLPIPEVGDQGGTFCAAP